MTAPRTRRQFLAHGGALAATATVGAGVALAVPGQSGELAELQRLYEAWRGAYAELISAIDRTDACQGSALKDKLWDEQFIYCEAESDAVTALMSHPCRTMEAVQTKAAMLLILPAVVDREADPDDWLALLRSLVGEGTS